MGCFYSRLIVVALLWAGAAHGACAPDRLKLRGPSGVQQFSVEIADTEAERETGLMFRSKLAMSAGMIFVYPAPQHAVFWMKNTLIPLDMVFADATGRVTRVHENAIPQDLTGIDGGEAVSFVLEINGGLAKRLGIAQGTQMQSALIEQSSALWPCSGE